MVILGFLVQDGLGDLGQKERMFLGSSQEVYSECRQEEFLGLTLLLSLED